MAERECEHGTIDGRRRAGTRRAAARGGGGAGAVVVVLAAFGLGACGGPTPGDDAVAGDGIGATPPPSAWLDPDVAAWAASVDPAEVRAAAAVVPGRPGWLERLTAEPAAIGRAPVAMARDDLTSLFARVAPPEGDVGPQVDERPVEPAQRRAAAERLERARAARAEGRLLRAVRDLQTAVELDPASIEARRELARTGELIGNLELAADAWRALASRRPSDPEAALALSVAALEAGRPLEAVSLLRPALHGPADRGSDGGASLILARPLRLALLRACEALAADAAAAEVAGMLLTAPERRAGGEDERRRVARRSGRTIAAMRGIDRTDAAIAMAAGDAHLRLGRAGEARRAWARAAAELQESADVAAGSASAGAGAGAARRPELAAALLVRTAWLELVSGALPAAWATVIRATTDPHLAGSPAPRRVAEAIAEALVGADSPGVPGARVAAASVAAAASAESGPAAAADRSRGPSSRILVQSDRVRASGPAWPHPLPDARAEALHLLRARPAPLGLDEVDLALPAPSGVGPVTAAFAFEACGWLGRAWQVLDDAAEGTGAADPRLHVARVRLAGLLRDPAALRRAMADAATVGLAPAAPRPEAPAPLAPPAGAATAWRPVLGVAAVAALARVGQLDEAVAFAAELRDELAAVSDARTEAAVGVPAPLAAGVLDDDRAAADPPDLATSADLIAAVDLALAAARAERAWTAGGDSRRREDVRDAVALAAAVIERRPDAGVAWELLDRILAPGGPVADPAARVRHRRQWGIAAANAPSGAALRRERLLAAGRYEAADDAARLALLVDPGDEAALEHLVAARLRDGRPGDAVAWLEDRLARRPADPVAATALFRVEAMGGARDAAWARLEDRLDRRRDDLVALRLAETAAGVAGDAMIRLVMGERRLLTRPASPHRDLLLARLAADAGQDRDAVQALRGVVEQVDDASDRDVLAASAVLRRLAAGDDDGAAPGPPVGPPAGLAGEGAAARTGRPDASLEPSEALEIELATRLAARPGAPVEPVVRGLGARLRRDGPDAGSLALVDALARDARDARSPGRRPGTAGVLRVVDPWRPFAADLLAGGLADRAAVAVARRLLRGAETGRDLEDLVALHVALAAATSAAAEGADGVTPIGRPLHERLAPAAIRAAAGLDAGSGGAAPTALVSAVLARLAGAGRLAPYAAPDAAAPGPRDERLAAALLRAAQVHRLVGAPAAADALLAQALELAPDDPGILNDLGYTRLEAADRVDSAAARLIERAHRLDPGSAAITDSLGWLRYRQGRLEDGPDGEPGALGLLERAAAAAETPTGEILLHLGDARWRAGDRAGAAEAWRRGARLDGSDAHRTDTEQRLRVLQEGVWGVLVRDPGRMYDATFGPTARALRERLAALDPAGDGTPPVRPTDAEVANAVGAGTEPSGREN